VVRTKKTLRVVIASPRDVDRERSRVKAVLEELNRGIADHLGFILVPWMWETDSHPGLHLEGPQGRVDEEMQITNADLVVGIFWTRFGSPVSDARSGTEHELRLAWQSWRDTGRPQVMLYFKHGRASVDQIDADQLRAVQQFRKETPKEQLWKTFTSISQFQQVLREDITAFVRSRGSSPKGAGTAVRRTAVAPSTVSPSVLSQPQDSPQYERGHANPFFGDRPDSNFRQILDDSREQMPDTTTLHVFIQPASRNRIGRLEAVRAEINYEKEELASAIQAGLPILGDRQYRRDGMASFGDPGLTEFLVHRDGRLQFRGRLAGSSPNSELVAVGEVFDLVCSCLVAMTGIVSSFTEFQGEYSVGIGLQSLGDKPLNWPDRSPPIPSMRRHGVEPSTRWQETFTYRPGDDPAAIARRVVSGVAYRLGYSGYEAWVDTWISPHAADTATN
jgi:hypothetical protein